MNLSPGNLVRAMVGGVFAAGLTFSTTLGSFAGQSEGVNWLVILSAAGTAFFTTAGGLLALGPGVEPKP